MWNLPAPPGFRGLDPYLPVTKYNRFLPHWRQAGATYFVTFRLTDALPRSRIAELRQFRQQWEQKNPVPRSDDQDRELARELIQRVEHWLDQGAGSCVLRDPAISAIVVESLHHFDQSRYELGCYVVMPNHVHAVVRPLLPESHPVEELIGGWKKHSSLEINRLLHQSGALWQEESFDRIVRDEEHLYRVVHYIGENPQKAGLSHEQCPIWIRPEWAAAGWKFSWML